MTEAMSIVKFSSEVFSSVLLFLFKTETTELTKKNYLDKYFGLPHAGYMYSPAVWCKGKAPRNKRVTRFYSTAVVGV